jgi:hypothetical protein
MTIQQLYEEKIKILKKRLKRVQALRDNGTLSDEDVELFQIELLDAQIEFEKERK